MQLVAYPIIFDRIFLFQQIDKTLADIAEGSNVIGKDSEAE